MAILPVGQVLQARVFCAGLEQQSVNIVHYTVTANAGAGSSYQEIVNALSTQIAAPYKAALSIQWTFNGVRLQGITLGQTIPFVSLLGAGNGAIAGDCLPYQIAGLLSPRTAVPGRTGRGRLYLAPTGESQSDAGGRPLAAYLILAAAVGTAVYSQYVVGVGGNTTTISPVIYSRSLQIGIPVANVIVRNAWATQRRRSRINRPDQFGP